MAEGSETPNGERGQGPEGPGSRGEGDLLGERRARRAAESGEAALTRRAEAAEATVQTLERHVASLQQRLREAEDARQRIDEQIEAQRTEALEREHELRRVKQREYAEQQLRVEVEERLLVAERESRAEIDALSIRLSARERDAHDLELRLEAVQRQLVEAERATVRDDDPAQPGYRGGPGSRRRQAVEVASETTAVRAHRPSVAEREMQARLDELELRTAEIERRLDGERAARERSERLLESMREGHRRMLALVAEMKDIVARVSGALVRESPGGGPPRSVPVAPERREQAPLERERQGTEMADALAAAVERLRAQADAAEATTEQDAAERAGAGQGTPAPSQGGLGRGEQAAAEQPEELPPAPAALPAHKHAASWIGRMKIKRKLRRTR